MTDPNPPNSDKIRPLYDYANDLVDQNFTSVKYKHISRRDNTVADALAGAGIRGSGEEHRTVTLQLHRYPPVVG